MKHLGILLVDDDTAFRLGMEKYLSSQGYTDVRSAGTGELALQMVRQQTPGVVIVDLYLPQMNGHELTREIHRLDKNIPVFLLSCEDDDEQRHLAAKFGALDYLTKPITLAELFSYIELRLKSHASA